MVQLRGACGPGLGALGIGLPLRLGCRPVSTGAQRAGCERLAPPLTENLNVRRYVAAPASGVVAPSAEDRRRCFSVGFGAATWKGSRGPEDCAGRRRGGLDCAAAHPHDAALHLDAAAAIRTTLRPIRMTLRPIRATLRPIRTTLQRSVRACGCDAPARRGGPQHAADSGQVGGTSNNTLPPTSPGHLGRLRRPSPRQAGEAGPGEGARGRASSLDAPLERHLSTSGDTPGRVCGWRDLSATCYGTQCSSGISFSGTNT